MTELILKLVIGSGTPILIALLSIAAQHHRRLTIKASKVTIKKTK